eukprot:TRINITY_DN12509_c0_g1_i1.p2 TRINITY_DN12509_c0_g1~~TRINITY_DN12509_c0_g1_i1.p2  ORF type:complete len:134 (+),score=26.88 TRINITY_DN12509_c0_g1_i1:856-1257(+)
MEAPDWYDDDLPLQYQFGYSLVEITQENVMSDLKAINDFLMEEKLTTYLPFGVMTDDSDNGRLFVDIWIQDSNGAYANMSKKVKSTKNPNTDDNEILLQECIVGTHSSTFSTVCSSHCFRQASSLLNLHPILT